MKIKGKPVKVHLLFKIIIAIAMGIACGQFFPLWAAQTFQTFSAIFSQFLGFLIPLLIVGFVAPAIADVGNKAGKILILTVALAYISTTCGGLLAFFVGESTFPSLLQRTVDPTISHAAEVTVEPFFTITMPPLFDVMSGLILAFLLGICMAYMKGNALRNVMNEFRDAISMTIGRVIIPLLPLYIFCIFLNMTVTGQVSSVMAAFMKIILVIFAMHIVLLLLQYCIAALFVKRNPFKLLVGILPAYFTALGTQSSAATIPVTLRQVVKMGVSEDIAGFSVPLCATIHMSGSAMKITACALALMIMEGLPFDTSMFVGFVCMIGVSIVAAPGVPGGAIMASLGLLSSILGFSEENQALMIALYIAMDSFGTACNVAGDGAISLIVNRFFGGQPNPIPEAERM